MWAQKAFILVNGTIHKQINACTSTHSCCIFVVAWLKTRLFPVAAAEALYNRWTLSVYWLWPRGVTTCLSVAGQSCVVLIFEPFVSNSNIQSFRLMKESRDFLTHHFMNEGGPLQSQSSRTAKSDIQISEAAIFVKRNVWRKQHYSEVLWYYKSCSPDVRKHVCLVQTPATLLWF